MFAVIKLLIKKTSRGNHFPSKYFLGWQLKIYPNYNEVFLHPKKRRSNANCTFSKSRNCLKCSGHCGKMCFHQTGNKSENWRFDLCMSVDRTFGNIIAIRGKYMIKHQESQSRGDSLYILYMFRSSIVQGVVTVLDSYLGPFIRSLYLEIKSFYNYLNLDLFYIYRMEN